MSLLPNWLENVPKEVIVFASIVLGIFTFMSFVDGAMEAGNDSKGKCEYGRIVDFMPGHVIGCELWRKRW